jgi:hypothetical protein
MACPWLLSVARPATLVILLLLVVLLHMLLLKLPLQALLKAACHQGLWRYRTALQCYPMLYHHLQNMLLLLA